MNRVYRISRIGLYRVYRVYRIRLHQFKLYRSSKNGERCHTLSLANNATWAGVMAKRSPLTFTLHIFALDVGQEFLILSKLAQRIAVNSGAVAAMLFARLVWARDEVLASDQVFNEDTIATKLSRKNGSVGSKNQSVRFWCKRFFNQKKKEMCTRDTLSHDM